MAAERCDKEVAAAERAEYLFRASFARWPFVVYLLLFNSEYSIKVALVTPRSNGKEYHQRQPTNIRSSYKNLRARQSSRPLHRFLSPRAFICRSASFVERRLPSHIPSQDDSRTSSSCQPSALDPAFRLFHTRRHQRCFRSLSLTATYQGSQDPHRSKGRDACSSAFTDRGFLISPSLIVR